eukprot:RCo038284
MASAEEGQQSAPVQDAVTLEEVARLLSSGKAKNIIVMTGAGISVSAGIPDFRSPGTGLYAQLEKYDLPHPTSVFELNYFRQHPEPFYILAKEMWPGNFDPTDAHLFIKLLEQKGVLRRNYTQNIDCLERAAKINPELLMECHGTFATAHTIDPPHKAVPIEEIKARLDAGETDIRDKETGSLIKPDIVFFGESMPERFIRLVQRDFDDCDLLLVMGTSLTVHPFAMLTQMVPGTCPRVLFNNTLAGDFRQSIVDPHNTRDVAVLDDIQSAVNRFAGLCGWAEDFDALKRKFPNRRTFAAPNPIPELSGLSLKGSEEPDPYPTDSRCNTGGGGTASAAPADTQQQST